MTDLRCPRHSTPTMSSLADLLFPPEQSAPTTDDSGGLERKPSVEALARLTRGLVAAGLKADPWRDTDDCENHPDRYGIWSVGSVKWFCDECAPAAALTKAEQRGMEAGRREGLARLAESWREEGMPPRLIEAHGRTSRFHEGYDSGLGRACRDVEAALRDTTKEPTDG